MEENLDTCRGKVDSENGDMEMAESGIFEEIDQLKSLRTEDTNQNSPYEEEIDIQDLEEEEDEPQSPSPEREFNTETDQTKETE